MRSYELILGTFFLIFLMCGGLVSTSAYRQSIDSQNSTQALSLHMFGMVASAGNQNYTIAQNGPTLAVVIDGSPLFGSWLVYTLDVQQEGLSSTGSAQIKLVGVFSNGTIVTLAASVIISGSVSAAKLPLRCSSSSCTSEVPSAFTGMATVRLSSQGVIKSTSSVELVLESAYFDPFGDAITITAADRSLLILTNYTSATIDWTNVIDVGVLSGSLGNTPISGRFVEVATEHEDLVSGTAKDLGLLSLSNVINKTSGNQVSYMDAAGVYSGNSSIPRAGSYSCGVACTETGFLNSGSFVLHGGGGLTIGRYSAKWSVPAFVFSSVATGTVTA